MKARLPQGYGGGPQNMNTMIRQAQKMQEQMAEKQAELAEREFTASSGGGMVEIVMTGDKAVKSVTIKPEVVDPDDIEMLQDLVAAAIGEILRTVEDTTSAEMEEITGNVKLPGMF